MSRREVKAIAKAKNAQKKYFDQLVKEELLVAVDKRNNKEEPGQIKEKGFLEYVLSPWGWFDLWNSKGEDEYPEDEPSVPATPLVLDPKDPASAITNPILLNEYRKMEKVVRDHGSQLSKELGNIGASQITMKDGRVIEITIDLRQGKGKVFIGKSDVKPDFTMKMNVDTFVKLV